MALPTGTPYRDQPGRGRSGTSRRLRQGAPPMLTPDDAKATATTAYMFCLPLVLGYVRLWHEAIEPSSSCFTGGFGRWSSPPAESSSRAVSAWFDLRHTACSVGCGAAPEGRLCSVRPGDRGGAPSGTSRTTTSSAVMISGRRRPGRCCSRDPTVKTERFRRPCPGWACPLGATGRRTVSVRTPTAHAATLAGRWQRFAGIANARRPCGDLRPASVPRSRRIRIVVNRPIP